MTTAFVAGATGYTGRHVVSACAARGWQTIAHVRPDSPTLADWTQRFTGEDARVDSSEWVIEAMSVALAEHAPDVVFALLGTTRARNRRDGVSTYEAVDYGLTSCLLEASRSLERQPVFVYLSSMGAGGSTRNVYLQVRTRIEAELRAARIPHIIARPGFITGPDRDQDRLGETVAARIGDGALSILRTLGAKGLDRRYRSITGSSLATALVALAADPDARGVYESDALQALTG